MVNVAIRVTLQSEGVMKKITLCGLFVRKGECKKI
ncbi:hypothetical protein Ae168Ps1_6457 [Pseudonocardia sp. Ae168_Ps1]|nr:hypothetical protein Ae168Ps1_6457 [Pseudonocardia sp. Ae168_Ps1]OLL69814.1 hypothetical protein Ae150APs1_6276 [Pseudonocardia sp. Ae150A_Ps1]